MGVLVKIVKDEGVASFSEHSPSFLQCGRFVVKKLLLILILVGLTLAGVAYGWRIRQNARAEPVAYVVASVEHGALSEVVSATGLVQPRELFVVGSELPGKVTAVLADFNQIVEEGAVLLRLDDRMARERLQQADIAVELARVAVKQAETNRDTVDKAVRHMRGLPDMVRSQTELDLAEGKLRAAEVAVEAAQLKVREAQEAKRQAELGLRLTTIRAPILEAATATTPRRPGTGVIAEELTASRPRRSFVVLERKVSLNQQVGPPSQGHLFTLAADLDQMRVTAQVGEGDIDKVRRGMPARFTLSGAGDGSPKYTGAVADILLVPANEHGAVYYKVQIDVRNERDKASGDWLLRPGLTASLDIIRRAHEATWKLPAAAINFEPPVAQQTEAARAKLARLETLKDRDQWQTVWIVGADGKPWPIFVRTGGQNARGEPGIQDGQFTEVLEWDAELKPTPDPSNPSPMQVITGMPAPKKGLFSIPNIKY
jgi:HlyD family secretion protein